MIGTTHRLIDNPAFGLLVYPKHSEFALLQITNRSPELYSINAIALENIIASI